MHEETRSAGLLVLAARFRPFRSFIAALAVAIVVLLCANGRITAGLTELTYFVLAPYYIVLIAIHRRDFFGDSKGAVLAAIGVAALTAALLYLADIAIRAFALSGGLRVQWSPVPLHMVLFATAGAVVETVFFQLGVQARIRGWAGVAIAALLFYAFHLSLSPIFLLAGIALAVLQTITRRPGSPLIAHALYNGLISFVPPL